MEAQQEPTGPGAAPSPSGTHRPPPALQSRHGPGRAAAGAAAGGEAGGPRPGAMGPCRRVPSGAPASPPGAPDAEIRQRAPWGGGRPAASGAALESRRRPEVPGRWRAPASAGGLGRRFFSHSPLHSPVHLPGARPVVRPSRCACSKSGDRHLAGSDTAEQRVSDCARKKRPLCPKRVKRTWRPSRPGAQEATPERAKEVWRGTERAGIFQEVGETWGQLAGAPRGRREGEKPPAQATQGDRLDQVTRP